MIDQSQIYSILSFPAIQSSDFSHFLQKKEDIQTNLHECRIKRRSIEHVSMKKMVKKNGNMPKSIIGNFLKYLHKYEHLYSSNEDYDSTKKIMTQWLKNRFDLGLPQLYMLLGGSSQRSLSNCRALREIISNEGLEMIGEKTKVANNLSYLICLEKYIYRLGNPELTGRIQSR